MRFINTKTHGILDYLVGIFLLIMPWLFGFNSDNAETWVPMLVGGVTILFSLFTNYELGLIRKIPMSIHLLIDFTAGIFLAISPWLFGFSDKVYLPHLILGITELFVVLFSKTKAYEKPRVIGYPNERTL